MNDPIGSTVPIAVSEVLVALKDVRQQSPSSWLARCPAHDQPWGDLQVSWQADTGTRLYCRAGCRDADVWGALGLVWRR